MNTENGVKPHEAMMLFNPMDGFMNKAYEMGGKFLKSFFDSVQLTSEDKPDKFRFNYFVAISHRLWGLSIVNFFYDCITNGHNFGSSKDKHIYIMRYINLLQAKWFQIVC